MAPIRRYLRITKYSVLEVRIYLDNPALAQSWLLNPRESVLSRVIQAVRPLVLPKLREENERGRGKGKSKKWVKDVVVEEDFEISIFLTDLSSRHSLLTKQKKLHPKQERLCSNSNKLTGWLNTRTNPVIVDANEEPVIVREESDDDGSGLDAYAETPIDDVRSNKTAKRSRNSGNEAIPVYDSSEEEHFSTQKQPASKRRRADEGPGADADGDEPEADDDRKKLAMKTSYDGFNIYSRILCLVVKRRGGKGKIPGASANESGEQMLENWVSTQAAQNQIIDES